MRVKRKVIAVVLTCIVNIVIIGCESEKDLALSLDGDGDYMEIPTHAPINEISGTISVWISPNQLSKTRHVFHAGEPTGDGAGTEDEFHISAGIHSAIGILLSQGRSIAFEIIVQGVIEEANWYYVAATWDSESVRLYLNGSLIGTRYPLTQMNKRKWAPWMRIGFCNGRGGTGSNVNRFFSGVIDDIRIWDVALTEEEVLTAMTTGLTGNEDGLVGYWNFDDGTARDISRNGNNGKLHGNSHLVASTR